MRGPDPAAGAAPWIAFGRAFAATVPLVVAGYLALGWIVDPYETGRSDLLSTGTVRPQGPRTAAPSRGRDPAFAGAIFGNSHIQLVEPARLSQATGIPFVQLSVAATGPGEQFVLLGWFLRHHPRPRALVLAADAFWCMGDPALPARKPFPYWLFEDDPAAYLRGLMRWSTAQEVVGRLGWLLKRKRAEAARDGWWDYEPNYLRLGYGRDPALTLDRGTPVPDAPDPGEGGPAFPAAERLADFAARLPEETALVLVFPPVHASALARPGTERARAEAACKAALRQALERHPRSRLLDWRGDGPEAHDAALFFDRSHYRLPLARRLGDAIAGAVRELAAPSR